MGLFLGRVFESSGGWRWGTSFRLGGQGGNRDYAVDLTSVNNNIENRVMSREHNHASGLKCVLTARSRPIVNKMGELRLMVDDVEPYIIGITIDICYIFRSSVGILS